MKVLLIFPPTKLWVSRHLTINKGINDESGAFPPLGLLYVASYLEKNINNCRIEIIDAPTEKFEYRNIEQKIIEKKPDVVGIYFNTEYLYDAYKTAETAKKADRNIIVVAGGPHITNYPIETTSNPFVDYCVFGEGEIAFKDLIDALICNKEPENIAGVISKKNTAKSFKLQKVENLDMLPFPNLSLLNKNNYKSFITYSNPITTIMTSRGCAYNCYYCSNIERSQKVRMRSAKNVVDEIEKIQEAGIKDIIIFDENFTFNILRVEEICDELIRRKINVRWHCRSRADMKFDKHILRKMKDAGCRMIQFGIDAGTQNMQQKINKKLDLEKVKQVVKMTKDAGILVYGNFMIGHPDEMKEEMKQTIDFAVKLGFDYAPFSIFNPLPGSVFYLEGLKNGIIKNDYWLEYVKDPQKPIADYFWPLQNKEMLIETDHYAYRKFYLRPKYMFQALFRKQSIKQKLWQLKAGFKMFVFNRK